jgi:hypothetical protein
MEAGGMPTPPSIKGRIFAPAVEDLQKLVADDAVDRAGLARWLRPQDFSLLDAPIVATEWYAIDTYARILDALRDVAGGGRNDYLCQRGVRSAERLLEAGLYQQFEYLNRTQVQRETDPRARFLAFGRDLKLLTTLSSSILSFSRWEAKPSEDEAERYVIEVSEAADFPDNLGWTSEGFVNGMAKIHGDSDLWRWRRAARDRVVFRMIRPI